MCILLDLKYMDRPYLIRNRLASGWTLEINSVPGSRCAILEGVLKPWPWLRSALDHGTRHQVTRLGLLFTLTCVLVSLAAFVSANNCFS